MDSKKIQAAIDDTWFIEGAMREDGLSIEKIRRIRAILRLIHGGL